MTPETETRSPAAADAVTRDEALQHAARLLTNASAPAVDRIASDNGIRLADAWRRLAQELPA